MSERLKLKDVISPRMMLAFEGKQPSEHILNLMKEREIAGFTFFRGLNVESAEQLRDLSGAIQVAAKHKSSLPLLIAADQEGGQLIALGDETTPFIGNMALGAVGDPTFTEKIGYAIGTEMRALGVNINYSPVCDLNTNPLNPSLGIRAFSDTPALAASMTSAMVRGLQRAGVAAVLKHFPGKGGARVDSHKGLPVIDHNMERLDLVELPAFKAGISAGAKLVMTGHFAMPELTGSSELPATLSRAVMNDLLRERLGFEGVLISDALDMHAITQGAGQIIDVIAAVRAGVDLLLLTKDMNAQERIYQGLLLARSRGLLKKRHLFPALKRIKDLRQWVADFQQPGLEVVRCDSHLALANELAERSITLVRNASGLLPIQPDHYARLDVIQPQSEDLTPADTSSYVKPALAEALRAFHPFVNEQIVSQQPADEEIADILEKTSGADLIIVGTINASMQTQQGVLVNELIKSHPAVVTIALRTPYDILVYPLASTHVCTYSILPISMAATASALFGKIGFQGRLPVSIPG